MAPDDIQISTSTKEDAGKVYNSVCRKSLLQIYFNSGVQQTAITKFINASYGQCIKALKYLEKAKLVSAEKNGRIKKIYITDKGKKIVRKIEEINRIMAEE